MLEQQPALAHQALRPSSSGVAIDPALAASWVELYGTDWLQKRMLSRVASAATTVSEHVSAVQLLLFFFPFAFAFSFVPTSCAALSAHATYSACGALLSLIPTTCCPFTLPPLHTPVHYAAPLFFRYTRSGIPARRPHCARRALGRIVHSGRRRASELLVAARGGHIERKAVANARV